MANSASMAEQSAWFRKYEGEVNGAKKASNGNKGLLVIIPILLIGGAIFMMVRNGALESEQTKGAVYMLAGIGIVLVLMILILTGRSKKTDAAGITRKDLDSLLKNPQDAAAFDAQMSAEPVFRVENTKDQYIFATKDFLGTKFNHLGNVTYRFIAIGSISVLHTVRNGNGSCDVEFRNGSGDVLLTWVAENGDKVEEVKDCLRESGLNLDAF
ncbi:MAG: hypothetical protein K6E50_12770 [Lachnospiraceae bacterium]|nr:hypothetical protein [Lachnospiraceae bacterium]